MSRFDFYRQERVDGGIRAGIDCDDGSSLQSFEAGNTDDDPALSWYVDVHGELAVELDATQTRDWLQSHAEQFRLGFRRLAERFSVGMDDHQWPRREPFPADIIDAELFITISAGRRVDAIAIGEKLTIFADQWDSILADLQLVLETT